jgi:hypothetical protein
VVSSEQISSVKTKRILRSLDAVNRVLGKLGMVAINGYLLAKLIYDLYQSIAQH